MTVFQEAVVRVVRAVPKGKVVSYGQVAAYIGTPRAARQVGWILRGLPELDLPWWRVINNSGRISIKGNVSETPQTQRDHLLKDGVEVSTDFQIDIKKYRWLASLEEMNGLG